MKKFLSLALALLIVGSSVVMTACGDKDDDKNPDTETPDTETPNTETPDANEPEEVVFTTVDENVKALVTVELRRSPEIDADNVIGSLRVGEIVQRTAYSSDGLWSRVHMTPAGFDEGDYYVASNCLTIYDGPLPSDEPDEPENPGTSGSDQPGSSETPDTPAPSTEFVEISPAETVYVITDALNLRTSPTTELGASNIAGAAVLATPLTRTAKNDRWSRVTYMGGEYYVSSEYVTAQNFTGSDYVTLTTPAIMTVTAAQSLNVRTYPYVSDEEMVERLIIAGGLSKGDTVTVVAEAPDKEWVRIAWEGGTYAYVRAKFLSGYGGATSGGTMTPSTPSTPAVSVAFSPLNTAVAMIPNAAGVRVYSTPDELTTPADTLSPSDVVLAVAVSTDTAGKWMKINLSATDPTPYYVLAVDLRTSGKG